MVETTVQTNARYVQDRWTVGTAINIGHVHLGRERTPLFASAIRDSQLELIRRHAAFGGREQELQQLELSISQSQGPYHFVWGGSGMGKTAFLANWIARLRSQGRAVCFHFINRLDDMAGEETMLRNLCEQLVEHFQLSGELPVSVEQLRAAYIQLLHHAAPENGPLIIVIDGLDEAKGWTPKRTLFPTRLPENIHIVFSARAQEDKSRERWLNELGIAEDRVDSIRLDRLNEKDIKQLLRDSGGNAADLAGDRIFVHAIATVSEGDPFYLQYLLRDIQSGDVTKENASDQPQGLRSYLEQWQSDLFDDVDIEREEVYDLLIVLIVALGRLKPGEIMGISPRLRRGMLLQRELNESLRRYLVGNRETGYSLCHSRFRDFLCADLSPAELETYRQMLLAYCRGWHEHKSDYALNHLAAHLADADETTELNRLIDASWQQARYEQTASHRPFAEDLEIIIGVDLNQSPPQVENLVTACLAYATLMSLAGNIAPEVLGEMARLGRLRSAHDHAVLISHPGARANAYLSIGAALEKSDQASSAGEYLALALVATERIADAKECGSILVKLAEGFHRLGDNSGLHETLSAMERVGRDLHSDSLLALFASSFRRFGEAGTAAEFARRARTAYESAGWTLVPNPLPVFSALVTAGLFEEAEEFITSKPRVKGVDDALRKLREAKKEPQDTLDTARLAQLSSAALEVDAGLDFSGLGFQASAEPHASETLCQQASEAFKQGDRENARSLAMQAFAQARAEPVSYGAFGFDSSVGHLCNVSATLAEIGEPQAALEAASAALDQYAANRWMSVHAFAQIPIALARAGEKELAHDLALRIVRTYVNDAGTSEAHVLLTNQLIDLGMTSTAESIVDEVVAARQTLEPEPQKAMLRAGLALTAARCGFSGEAIEIADSVLPALDELDTTDLKARILGRLALARAIADPSSALEAERARTSPESASDRYKIVACAAVARALLENGKKTEAQTLANNAIDTARQVTSRDADLGLLLVECARTMQGLGNREWAVEQLDNLIPLTKGSSMTGIEAYLLGDLAAAFMDAGEVARAAELAQKTLARAVTYSTELIASHLTEVVDVMIEAGEERRANFIVNDALKVLGTMEPDWQFTRALPAVAMAVARNGNRSALENFAALAKKNLPNADRIVFLCSLCKAQAAFAQNDKAQKSAMRALQMILGMSSVQHGVLAQVAEALARVGDKKSFEKLAQWVFGEHPSRVPDLLLALIPSLGTIGDKTLLERVMGESSNFQPYHRARVMGAAALAWLAAKDRSKAESAAAQAEEAFFEVTDGAATPDLIEYLVPALRALRDRDGLMRVLQMPWPKWPYAREYIPTLRALLPALTESGVDDIDAKYFAILGEREQALGEALAEIAAMQARHGELERAKQTATSLSLPHCRAAALVGIARAIAERSEPSAAADILREALSTAIDAKASIALICDITRAALAIGDKPMLSRLIHNELETIASMDFIAIDTRLYLQASRTLVRTDDKDRIVRSSAIALAATHPAQKADALAALQLAFAESGDLDQAGNFEAEVRASIDALEDDAAKAMPLCHYAKSLALEGRHDEAKRTICQAFHAARVMARADFLSVLDHAFEVLSMLPGYDPIALDRALERADVLWQARGGE